MSTAKFGNHITPGIVEELLGLAKGSLGSIAWVMMQEESQGVGRELIAKGLGATVGELKDLEEVATGLTGEDSADLWGVGIVALKTVALTNAGVVERGWDSIEAMAVQRLAAVLSTTKTSDIDSLGRIANIANKAIRRGSGESQSNHGSRQQMANQTGGLELTMQAGNLGSIKLSLSPKIQEQLQRPGRVIEGVAARIDADKNIPQRRNLEMLKLNETRDLVDADGAGAVTAEEIMQAGKQEVRKGKHIFDFSGLLELGLDGVDVEATPEETSDE